MKGGGKYVKLWLTEEQVRWRNELAISNLSEYLRDKMRADVDRGVSLRALKTRIAQQRAKLAELQVAFEARAVQVEDALQAFEKAASQVRANVARMGARAAVQTSILAWVRHNPHGRELRRMLPPTFADPQIVDILLRWPESRPEIIALLELRDADEPHADGAARGEARSADR